MLAGQLLITPARRLKRPSHVHPVHCQSPGRRKAAATEPGPVMGSCRAARIGLGRVGLQCQAPCPGSLGATIPCRSAVSQNALLLRYHRYSNECGDREIPCKPESGSQSHICENASARLAHDILITIDDECGLRLRWRRPATRESPRTAAGSIRSCAGHRCVPYQRFRIVLPDGYYSPRVRSRR